MLPTCLPPGPLLDQLSWTWGAPATLSGTRTSSIPLLYSLTISQVLVPSLRTEYQFASSEDGRIGGIGDRDKEEEMLKKVEMGKNPKECFT